MSDPADNSLPPNQDTAPEEEIKEEVVTAINHDEDTPPAPKRSIKTKSLIGAFTLLLFLSSLVGARYLVQQNADTRKKAAEINATSPGFSVCGISVSAPSESGCGSPYSNYLIATTIKNENADTRTVRIRKETFSCDDGNANPCSDGSTSETEDITLAPGESVNRSLSRNFPKQGCGSVQVDIFVDNVTPPGSGCSSGPIWGICNSGITCTEPTNTPPPPPPTNTPPPPPPTATPPPPPPTNTPPPPGQCGDPCEMNDDCDTQYICYNGYCRFAPCPSEPDCLCSEPLPTPTPTATPPPPTNTPPPPGQCGDPCETNDGCDTQYICYSDGYCRNPSCPSDPDCVCFGPSPTPTPTPIPHACSAIAASANNNFFYPECGGSDFPQCNFSPSQTINLYVADDTPPNASCYGLQGRFKINNGAYVYGQLNSPVRANLRCWHYYAGFTIPPNGGTFNVVGDVCYDLNHNGACEESEWK